MSQSFFANPPLWMAHAAIDLLPMMPEPVAGIMGLFLFFVCLIGIPVCVVRMAGIRL